jgi:hypothetical protein
MYMDPGAERTRELYQEVLELDPGNEVARLGLEEVEKEFASPKRRASEVTESQAHSVEWPPPRQKAHRDTAAPGSRRTDWQPPVLIAIGILQLVTEADVRVGLTVLFCIAAAAVAGVPLVRWQHGRSDTVGLNLGPGTAHPQSAARRAGSQRRRTDVGALNVGHGVLRRRLSGRNPRAQTMSRPGGSIIDPSGLLKGVLIVLVVLLAISLIW